jgi:tetratricopeptide (TPR) repeat protein
MMGKEPMLKKDSNIVMFPGLEKKLLEKGLQHLQQKNFPEAVDVFEQSIHLNPKNHESYIGLLLAYFDGGMTEKAIKLGKQMLEEGIGNEIETMNIYIMLLVQRHEYKEVVSQIKRLLQDHKIPFDKLEHFQRLLQLSEKMLEDQIEIKEIEKKDIRKKSIDFFQYHDPQEQMMLAAELNSLNIQPYLADIKKYLRSDKGDPFFKTLILNVLKEQNYDHPIEIEKFSKEITIIPAIISNLMENEQLEEIIEEVRDKIEDEDPTLYKNIRSLIERHFFLLYPFPLEEADISAYAAAYHMIGNEYFGNNDSAYHFIKEYGIGYEDFEKADSFIRMIEEVSYRNLSLDC